MDVSFSGAEIALVGVLLTAVTAPLSLMFRMLVGDKDRQIARLEQQNQVLLDAVLSGAKAVENTTTVLRQRPPR